MSVHPSIEQIISERRATLTENDDGWHDWMDIRPPDGLLLEIIRDEWDAPLISKREDLPPEMNAVGLKWRLTGIAKQ